MANEAKQFTIGGVTHDVMDVGARQAIASLQNAIDAITSGDTTTAIKTFQEVIDFLEGVTDDATLIGKLNELRTLINAKYSKPASGIPASDLANGVIPDVSGFATKTEVNAKANDADVVKSISVNGQTPQTPTNGNVNIQVQTGEQVSVIQPTNPDGTFTIRVGETDYTINLNHTHENMAKLVVCEESDLPSTLEKDTIYAQVDNAETPREIRSLWIAGLEFAGGGGAAPDAPRLISPSQAQISYGIDIGNTTSGVATYLLNIIARDITQSLLVEWGNGSTGYSFNTSNLPTGVSYDSGTGKLTITKEAAASINGVDIPVVYTGSDTDENAEGTLGISSSSVDGINEVVTLVANKVKYENLAGVKLTGTQWLQTDYYPNANTEFRLECKFTANARTTNHSTGNVGAFLRCNFDTNTSDQRFSLHTASANVSSTAAYHLFYWNNSGTDGQASINMESHAAEMVADHAVISYAKGSSAGTLTFNGGTPRSVSTTLQTETLTSPMCIGYRPKEQTMFNVFDLTIYEFTITEGGNVVRHWVPKLKGGTPGLYDTITGSFISSETNDELVAIPLT